MDCPPSLVPRLRTSGVTLLVHYMSSWHGQWLYPSPWWKFHINCIYSTNYTAKRSVKEEGVKHKTAIVYRCKCSNQGVTKSREMWLKCDGNGILCNDGQVYSIHFKNFQIIHAYAHICAHAHTYTLKIQVHLSVHFHADRTSKICDNKALLNNAISIN